MKIRFREFIIDGSLFHPDNKLTEDEFTDSFMSWLESEGLLFGGVICENNDTAVDDDEK